MSRRNENWLLVEWCAGGRQVVHIKTLLKPLVKDLKIGYVITLLWQGEPQIATLIARARDRDQLNTRPDEPEVAPSPKPDEEPGDYSPSGSSWAPSGEDDSGDSDIDTRKKVKLDHRKSLCINRRSSKKIMTPSHRAPAIIPKVMQDAISKNSVSRKRPHKGDSRNGSINKSLPDSTKRNNTSEVSGQTVTIDARELVDIRNSFRVLFRMIEELKRPTIQTYEPQISTFENTAENTQIRTYNDTSIPLANVTAIEAEEDFEDNEEYENEEFNRSDDNILITNKYDNNQFNASVIKPVNNNQYNIQVNPGVRNESNAENKVTVPGNDAGQGKSEWVPIGSGKTLIHIDQWTKVNWKSYTVATRTLLQAVFPRRILATHCLTGRKSPAFQNKPPKMCLDPKIISDVIMEIMDRFDVKENLVRGMITTKCADECKMWKQRANKRKNQLKSEVKTSNRENEPPSKDIFVQNNHAMAQ